MGTRIRCKKSISHLFEHFFIFQQNPNANAVQPIVLYSFPPPAETQCDADSADSAVSAISLADHKLIIDRVQHFAFPAPPTTTTSTQHQQKQNFSFVLTNGDGEWTFGYCRQQSSTSTTSPTPSRQLLQCLMFLSHLPYWNSTFYKILDHTSSLQQQQTTQTQNLHLFLQNLYSQSVVQSVTATANTSASPTISITSSPEPDARPFTCTCPPTRTNEDQQLPSTLENRNLAEFYNCLSVDTIIHLFASLSAERRILIISHKLSRLSSIAMACNILLYPLCWQHVFIPVLPITMVDYLHTPFPFIIGLPTQTWNTECASVVDSSNVVVINADTNQVDSPFQDLLDLPNDIIAFFKTNLKAVEEIGVDGLAKVFMYVFIKLLGHVENSLAIHDNQICFDKDLFLLLAKNCHRSFLKTKLCETQMFQEFVDELIKNISCGQKKYYEELFYRELRVANGKAIKTLRKTQSNGGHGIGGRIYSHSTQSLRRGNLKLSSAVSALNISDPMPIVPDLIQFHPNNSNNDTKALVPSCAATLPRRVSKQCASPVACSSSTSDTGLSNTLNPKWTYNDLTNGQKDDKSNGKHNSDPICTVVVDLHNTCSSALQNPLSCSDLSEFEMTVRNYADLLKEYGLYKFYQNDGNANGRQQQEKPGG